MWLRRFLLGYLCDLLEALETILVGDLTCGVEQQRLPACLDRPTSHGLI